LEKLANNLANYILGKQITRLLFFAFFISSLSLSAQVEAPINYKTYKIGTIKVTGNTTFDEGTVITYSKLKEGDEITVPTKAGSKIAEAINKLWDSNLFKDVEIYYTLDGDVANIEISLTDLPELKDVTIQGVKKSKRETIIEENKLQSGVKVTENLITTTKNYIESTYRKKGYLNAKVIISTTEVKDSINKTRVNMNLRVDKGEKIKVRDIVFTGSEKLKDKKLRKAMKNTKKKNPIRVFKRSKYIEADFEEDLNNLVDKYKENGYRDARILSDSLIYNDDNTISLAINLAEGEKYTYGNIDFVGNAAYSDELLNSILRIRPGDTYNGVELEKRISDQTKPDANDLTNWYQNSGFLFSTITPVETSADGNVIDMEIRIIEGKPAYFNKISVSGNERTNDHVIYREIRTLPGQRYSKAQLIRTIRELGQLGFFDAQQIDPQFENVDPNAGTVDINYSVVEQGSSQIELQGGYGGGGFIGTLGLSFNNFAIKDIFKKEAYKPIPMGDGQKLSLRLQASRFFQTYSFSFSEPWLGGKKPVNFSSSISHTKQFLFDPFTRRADKSRSFNITGLSFGLAQRLTWPDDFFILSQAISFQHYDLNNYNTGLFTFGDGESKSLAYTIGLSRNNTATDPIYPTSGSSWSISAKLSPPYSLFDGVDYAALKNERDEQEVIRNNTSLSDADRNEALNKIGEIDQKRFNWLEFYKIKFKGEWYQSIVGNLVLKPSIEFGFLGAYDNDRGNIPFERFFLGGDGLGTYSLDGREAIALRGYPNQSLSSQDGGSIYNKFSLELRYPITLKSQQAKIYALAFLESGNSFNNFRDFDPFNLKRSAGLGIRLFMPAFGLLGIDFAHGFDPIGEAGPKHGWETHFIIGQQL
jgi:outer membrane protein insertion porin family